jgi:hypothetical protein
MADDDDDEEGDAVCDAPRPPVLSVDTVKITGFIFLLFVLLCTDVFVQRVLPSFGPTFVNGAYPSASGVLVQAALLSMGYVGFNVLVSHGFL